MRVWNLSRSSLSRHLRIFSAATRESNLCLGPPCLRNLDHVSCGWRFGSAIYQTTPLAFCPFRAKHLGSMTSSAPQNGRDHYKRPTVWQFVCSCNHLTQASSQKVLPSAKQNPRQTQSGERIQGPDMSRSSHTHPAVTPGVGLLSTRHVRDTPPANAPWEVGRGRVMGTRGSRMPGTRTPIRAGARHAICEIAYAGSGILFFLDAAVLRCRGFSSVRPPGLSGCRCVF